MIKEEMMAKIASDTMISRGIVEDVVNSMLENIEQSLVNGESVVFRGFGTFEAKERKAKIGRNVKAGIPVQIPAHITPVFKASDALKKKVYREV